MAHRIAGLKGWACFFLTPALVLAQPPEATDSQQKIIELRQQLVALQTDYQSRFDDLNGQIAAQIALIDQQTKASAKIVAHDTAPDAPMLAASGIATDRYERLLVAGDFRLRYENTSAYAGLPDRSRGVLRGRLGASYHMTDALTAGARLTTGDPGDPNTADVTMGDFVDDVEVSLDQAYLAYQSGSSRAVAGKFANPFMRTDLVWDGDVNPYGAAAKFLRLRDWEPRQRRPG